MDNWKIVLRDDQGALIGEVDFREAPFVPNVGWFVHYNKITYEVTSVFVDYDISKIDIAVEEQ